jgi:hypothetical protein
MNVADELLPRRCLYWEEAEPLNWHDQAEPSHEQSYSFRGIALKLEHSGL